MIDKTHGEKPIKKVIAQQVEEFGHYILRQFQKRPIEFRIYINLLIAKNLAVPKINLINGFEIPLLEILFEGGSLLKHTQYSIKLGNLPAYFSYASIVKLVLLRGGLNIIDEITQTRGRGNKEAVAQGTANIISGLLSGMGGCAMIGQSLINISAGARARLSGIVAAIMLLVFIMFGSGLIEKLPMAALTGLMIMVSIGTFEWASFRTFNRMPKSDVFVMIAVTLITVLLHNLALAVLLGVIIAALVFAWDNAKRIRARKHIDENGVKHYEIYGPLFFGSIAVFNEKFDVQNDPDVVIIDFAESRVVDMSAIEALNKITERYKKAGKQIQLKHLSKDCARLLKDAEKIISVNVLEDPTYKLVSDQLS